MIAALKSIINNAPDEVSKIADNSPTLNRDVELTAPYLIKKNYSHKELINYSKRWNWRDEFYTLVETEARLNKALSIQMNLKLKNFIAEYSSTNGSPHILDIFTKSFASIIISFVPRK